MTRRLAQETSLPDFRNMGVMWRVAVLAETASLLAAYAYIPGADFPGAYLTGFLETRIFEPVLLLAMLALFLAAPALSRLPYRHGCVAVVAIVVAVAVAVHAAYRTMFSLVFTAPLIKTALLAAVAAAALLGYFNWRYRILSPALTEARLMALQARIRPHFLFNSLNTALGLMRTEPRRAEGVIENLAELYRALLSETGALVPLGREIELAQAYADIEAIRLGSRLNVLWQCQGAPLDALVPPLLIQPLLENAVYHGIEPSDAGGVVTVAIFLKGDRINLLVRNPCGQRSSARAGNRMALTNIRERLALHFDAEAEMSVYEAGGEFVVQIRVPYRRGVSG